jgi:hypothetical protein
MSAVKAEQRLAAALVGMGLLVVVFFTGSHWVDVGDETCGGVYRPDMWLNAHECRGRMMFRSAWVLVLLALAAILLVIAAKPRSRRRRHAARELPFPAAPAVDGRRR